MDISDLQDDEIIWIGKLAQSLTQKWARKANTQRNLEEMCKEAEGAAHKRGILIKMHLQDVLIGGPPTMEVVGKLNIAEANYGFDHERKQHDVRKSKVRGEDILGQKETPDSRKVKE